MSRSAAARRERLLPGGVPRYVRCYDNGGESADRYSVLFTGRYTHKTGGEYLYLAMSAAPFHPQGVGMHGGCPHQPDTMDSRGRPWARRPPSIRRMCHLGRRVEFSELPDDCRKLVLRDYMYIWDLKEGAPR